MVVGIIRALPETRDPKATPSRDLLGVALTMLGMGAIVFGLIEAETYGWRAHRLRQPVARPVRARRRRASMVAFVFHERRRAAAGMPVLVDLGLFAIPTFSAGVVAALIVAFGEFGLLFTLPLLLQGTLGYTALQTGWVIVALALGTFLISGALPRISRFVPQRTVVQVGLGLEAAAVGRARPDDLDGRRGLAAVRLPVRLRRRCRDGDRPADLAAAARRAGRRERPGLRPAVAACASSARRWAWPCSAGSSSAAWAARPRPTSPRSAPAGRRPSTR